MSAQDHALEQLPAADEPASTSPPPLPSPSSSPSPPRRDSVEDADPSFTRKRPRLDSGSNSLHTMSASSASPTRATTSPPPELVEMTIRSQPPSSPAPAASGHVSSVDGTRDEPMPDSDDSPIIIFSTENEPGSPLVVIIDDDDEDGDVAQAHRFDSKRHFQSFPFAQNGDYHGAVHMLVDYAHNSAELRSDLLPKLSQWLGRAPEDPSICIHNLYIDKAPFWDDFADFVEKILVRRYQWISALRAGHDNNMSRYPFGEQFGDDAMVDKVFYEFLNAYTQLCTRLFLVDIHLVSHTNSEEQYLSPLISLKHLQHLPSIFRAEKSPVFHLLHKKYAVDTRDMSLRLHREFVRSTGPVDLLRLTEEIFHRVPYNTRTAVAAYTSQILDCLGWFIFSSSRLATIIDRPEFYRGVLLFFTKYSGDLQNPGQVTDAAVARDLIQSYFVLIRNLCEWDKGIAAHLVDDLMEFADPESPTTSAPAAIEAVSDRSDYLRDPDNIPALVANAWRFKLLRKYIVKGRMELRVMSIALMDIALVDFYRELGNGDVSNEQHPLLQYLADFLLRGRVIDYIISVDSHPQLISRSGNIAGFLVVTHRWVDSQADAIWNTVANSPDPRVVTATMTMLRGIVHLMAPVDLLYLSLKLYNLPLEKYTMEIFRFVEPLIQYLKKGVSPTDIEKRGINAQIWNVCIRMIRDTAPSRESTKHTVDLHAAAVEQLSKLAAEVPVEDKHEIYRQCVEHIAARSQTATGSVRVISILNPATEPPDVLFSQDSSQLLRQVLEELPSFVKAEMQGGAHPFQLKALSYRLELLTLLIHRPCLDIPARLCNDLWDHVVGEYAFSNEARDLAWAQFSAIVRVYPTNGFCKLLITSYAPDLDSRFYTPGLFEFVANYKFPVTRKLLDAEPSGQTLLQIPGGDLLWSFMLSAPYGTIEDRAAHQLAVRYVEVADRGDTTLAEVESAHVALVEQCMQELRSAFKATRTSTDSGMTDDSTDTEEMSRKNQARFGRILLFLRQLLELVRRKAVLNRSKRTDSKVETMETDIPNGDAITLRYQCGSFRESVAMAPYQTIGDLYQKLCSATGLTKVNLFAKGKRVNIAESANQRLSSTDLGGLLLVQKADGAEVTHPNSTSSPGCSVFETTVATHFDELFTWMDSGDMMSRLLFDFLSRFPTRNSIVESVVSNKASLDSLFPPGKFFQAKYAAQALRMKLEEQLRSLNFDHDFLANSVQLLDKALLNSDLIESKTLASHEVQLAVVLIDVLLQFLRERPPPDISTRYFSDANRLTDRLMEILSIALEADSGAVVAQTCYATIVEASLHSRAVWEAFTNHSEIVHVHETLLLTDTRAPVREHTKVKINSICGGHLPSACPLNKPEIVAQYWNIVSIILPKVVQHAEQSDQLFGIAEILFRANDEHYRNEEFLREHLTCWSTLLLSYRHREIPGGSEVDQVVFGFARLLRCCITSLKSFKKPLNACSLMISISETLVFMRSLSNSKESEAEGKESISQLPVLSSATRKELYDLLLALADDRNAYNTLLQLTGRAEKQDSRKMLPLSVDRRMEIRSPTGYVGLQNPRAICYMNSLLTQLFMNLNFRQFMLGMEVQEAEGSQHLLSETQKLFAEMQTSFRRAADPRPFVACVKNLDKTPIDMGVQMDADEFYNLLFDQWEAQLVREEDKQKFRAFYGGQTLQQVKSKECEHVSERAETFFALQCDVQGKANLRESLQSFVQGDVMEGDNKYKCESCGGKFVDAVKRTCLKDVPDNLIFHLKRFDFDLNDLSRKKIHDQFEFPDTIDVGLYNIDHLSDPTKPHVEDIFDLVGVVVHFGNCENGHYYSYIRKRPCPEGGAASTWLHFNDSDVDPFDRDEIPHRAFGGPSDDGYTRSYKLYSAYMLFYQRRTAIEKDQRQWAISSQEREPKVAIPQHLEDEINNRNKEFIREYCLFDPNHSAFVRQLYAASRTITHGTCSEDHEQETHALRTFLAHISGVVWRHATTSIFNEALAHLRRATMSCSACCNIVLKWLAADDTALFNLLLQCPHQTVRSQTRHFLIDCLKSFREAEPILYGVESADVDMELDTSASLEGVLAAIVRRLRLIAYDSYQCTRNWDDLYLTLTRVVEMGHVETAVLLSEGLLVFCLQLFCTQANPAFCSANPELTRSMEKKKPIFNKLIQFTAILLSRMELHLPMAVASGQQTIDRMTSFDREQMRFALTQLEFKTLFHWSDQLHAFTVFDKMLELFDGSTTEQFYPGDVLKWMLGSSDPHIHEQGFTTISQGITATESPLCDAYVRVALNFCEVCPIMNNVKQVVVCLAKAARALDQADDTEISVSSEALVHFFSELPTVRNETLFERKHPDIFFQEWLNNSCLFVVPLLVNAHEYNRRAAYEMLRGVFLDTSADSTVGLVAAKYDTVRRLIDELTERTVYEANSGALRSHLEPMMAAGLLLTDLLSHLSRSEDPNLEEIHHENDIALIQRWQSEVENRARMWPDEGTPTSTVDGAFNNSDYGSESEEVELLDD